MTVHTDANGNATFRAFIGSYNFTLENEIRHAIIKK